MSGFGTVPFGTGPFGGGSSGGFGFDPFSTSPFGGGPASEGDGWTDTPAPAPRTYRPTAEWVIHPRQSDLSRQFDPLSNWSRLVLVERHNSPSTWTVTGPASTMNVFAPGSGSILDRNGVQIVSGSVTRIQRGASKQDNGRLIETVSVTFAEDLKKIGDRIIFPTPSFNLTGTVSNFPDAYDLRTGAIETLIIGYIRSHAGDLAQLDRRVPRLRVPVSLGRGGTTQVSGRLDYLSELLPDLAEAGNLRIRVVHTEDGAGAWLDLVIDAVNDLSDDIRFGTAYSTASGIIEEWDYDISSPEVTRAIVAGGNAVSDDPTTRDFLQIDELAAETLWGGAVEKLIDQRQVDPASANKQDELTRAGQEGLDKGAAIAKVSFSPVLGPDLEYRRDVRVGDIVGYDLPGLDPAEDKIREATTIVTIVDGEPTERVSVVVGTPEAADDRAQQQQRRALRAINVIQRSQ